MTYDPERYLSNQAWRARLDRIREAGFNDRFNSGQATSTYHPGRFDVVGHCAAPDCGIPMLSKEARRQGVRKEGHGTHEGHGLCSAHYKRKQRHGSFEKRVAVPKRPGPGRPQRTREDVLEEYLMIRDDVDHVRQAAERMGMSFAALDRALLRARKDGLSAGLPPSRQMDRAEAVGRPYRVAEAP